MFDRSFLLPADLEFVVMTDTHYMLDPGARQVEFESRRRQAARAAHAYRLVRSLDPAFVVHLGDLVQEFPESAGFDESLEQALAQVRDADLELRQVAGNHDVGDKPDPTMPTDWATSETLRAFHDRFGSSWASWSEAGCHFVILNSQIMNGPLPEAREQERWLERDLADHDGMPTFLFLHLAPFLVDEQEQGLGHYDNIDEPARSWLLGLVRAHPVQMVFAGHSHFAFFNRIDGARSYVVPSTAFTRPGFCEVFSSAPPPERGRDDAKKLGFFVVRVRDGVANVHFVRTGGATDLPDTGSPVKRILTGTTRDLTASPLGVTLRHPLAPVGEVPIAWQSTIRQPVRNDFPLLALLELGVRYVRVPASDLANPVQRERLAVLRDEGVSVTAMWIWSDRCPVVDEVERHRDLLDGVEIQLPGALLPDDACLEAIDRCRDIAPVTLSPLLPREIVPGKQHARTRFGYHLDELDDLERSLEARDAAVDRVLCRVDATEDPWDAIVPTHDRPASTRIGAIDWAVEFADADPAGQSPRGSAAMMAIACLPGSRLYLEPLVDLDRTMDAPPGLLDRLCNPRPVFHAVRTINTVLFSQPRSWNPLPDQAIRGATAHGLAGEGRSLLLVIPEVAPVSICADALGDVGRDATNACLYTLVSGTSASVELRRDQQIEVVEAAVLELAKTAHP